MASSELLLAAPNVDVHLAVGKLRRRHGWVVGAVEGLPGYRLEAWPFRFNDVAANVHRRR